MRTTQAVFTSIRRIGYTLALMTSACGMLDSPAPGGGGALTGSNGNEAIKLGKVSRCVKGRLSDGSKVVEEDSAIFTKGLTTSKPVQPESLNRIKLDLATWGPPPSPLFIKVVAESIRALERAELLAPDKRSALARPCEGFDTTPEGYESCAFERMLPLKGRGGRVDRPYPAVVLLLGGFPGRLSRAVTELNGYLGELHGVAKAELLRCGTETPSESAWGEPCHEIAVTRKESAGQVPEPSLKVWIVNEGGTEGIGGGSLKLVVEDSTFRAHLPVVESQGPKGACSSGGACEQSYTFFYQAQNGDLSGLTDEGRAELEIVSSHDPGVARTYPLQIRLKKMKKAQLRLDVLTRVLTELIDNGFPELDGQICD